MTNKIDQIYADTTGRPADFRFDDKVAQVFADMISRSVPGYGLTLDMIGVIAKHYVTNNSHCYDLGCSLGASTLAIRHNIEAVDSTIIAVDNSPAMIEQCRANLESSQSLTPVDLRAEDILATTFDNASLVTMNFTLQFIASEQRLALLSRIADGMNTGGALVLSEKIALPGSMEQALMTDLHHDFKAAMGYSQLEIAQKRQSIENVLIPDTIESHKERLHEAGFSQVHVWFQCFNFISLLAIK
ncbi:Carboxy-S-adenosyl-L-methionine synthase [Sinobacterium norvegicum]|uniref:Carboxy-S-adenosyl-L-methionine synthase n=1 Tax=Sinobacterium norvegicum TaxID=1641715 RepID=A0ABM9AE75_9GAMM|nr:carboxy-S-adenosyl-L-methionine synthase CmoA [Sinobacterium norvegicum]CAH0991498.1 Carboxy-S-adenosyl-L-methionine synthase [Sinobacterium norvegicum]